ncbi:MAG: hypothetical protein E7534_01025 [Ruminococcaceae bacterium]|nr:hypothetical protein [Oscillospiraceae bacterium]
MLPSLFWLLWPLLYACGAVGVGWAASSDEAVTLQLLSVLAGCLLPLRGIWYIFLARKNGTPLRLRMLIQTAVEILLVPIIVFLPHFSYDAFVIFLVLYTSFYGAVQTVNAVVYARGRAFSHFIPALCQAILFFHIFAGLLLMPDEVRRPFVISLSGFLLSILGHAYICDWLAVVVKSPRAARVFRKISIAMPGFVGLGVPSRLLDYLHGTDTPDDDDAPTDAQVIFSYGQGGLSIAGHCELCVDGKTYSYGNYDTPSQAVLNTLGNGIVFRAEKARYIDFLRSEGRTVVVFGLKFSDAQRAQFRETLKAVDRSLISWQDEATSTPPDTYIHRVVSALDAAVYRIDEGQWQTYFLPTINCVTFTAHLLGGTDAGELAGADIYTPGAFMDALHRLYLAENSTVVSLKTYPLDE